MANKLANSIGKQGKTGVKASQQWANLTLPRATHTPTLTPLHPYTHTPIGQTHTETHQQTIQKKPKSWEEISFPSSCPRGPRSLQFCSPCCYHCSCFCCCSWCSCCGQLTKLANTSGLRPLELAKTKSGKFLSGDKHTHQKMLAMQKLVSSQRGKNAGRRQTQTTTHKVGANNRRGGGISTGRARGRGRGRGGVALHR